MKEKRERIAFTSCFEGEYWHTDINLLTLTIRVRKEKELIFLGSMQEFKELELIKARHTDKIYEDILRMSEQLIKMLTEK